MTNKDAMNLWIRMIGEYCHCYPDANGNMPCDNGVLCDTCVYDKDLQKAYREKLEESNKK